jgi:hypothetical protein
MSEQRSEAIIRQFPRQPNHLGAGDAAAVPPVVPDAALRPERLAYGGAVHAGPLHRKAWWIEPLSAAIAVVVAGALIGLGRFVIGR